MRSARSDDREQRRRDLLAAADRAIRRHGAGVTMAQMAAEAGITKPVLYRHFENKGGLYEALARHYVDDVAGAIERGLAAATDPRRRLRVTIDAFLSLVEEEPEVHRFLMSRAISERPEAQRALSDFLHQLGERIAGVLSEEFENLGVDPGPIPPIAHGLVGMVQSAAEWWLTDSGMDRPELVERLERFAWQGLWGLPAEPGPDATDPGVRPAQEAT